MGAMDIGDIFKPTFGFENSQSFQFKEWKNQKFWSPLYVDLTTQEKIALALCFSEFGANSLK